MRVLLVERHLAFAEALALRLEVEGYEITGIAETGQEASTLAQDRPPDLALIEFESPDLQGVDVGKELLRNNRKITVVGLAHRGDRRLAKRAITSGFRCVLTKGVPFEQLLKVIRRAVRGERVVAPAASQLSSSEPAARRTATYPHLLLSHLTAREREVFHSLARGDSSSKIAEYMGISPHTVRTHTQNLLMKLGVHSRFEAVGLAARHGLIEKLKKG